MPDSEITFLSKKNSLVNILNILKIHPFSDFDEVYLNIDLKRTSKNINDFIDFEDEIFMESADNNKNVNDKEFNDIMDNDEIIPIGNLFFFNFYRMF